jgi:predicted MFS family arabinose efflux permease
MLIAVNAPQHRGAVFSLFNLFDDLGKGLGAWVVGGLAASMGREPAFHLSNLMWLFSGTVVLLTIASFPRDERNVQLELAASQEPTLQPEPSQPAIQPA